MVRARSFVIRDKEDEIASEVIGILDGHLEIIYECNEDDLVDGKMDSLFNEKLKLAYDDINKTFGIELDFDWFLENHPRSLALVGTVALKLLDKNPPDTKPPWGSLEWPLVWP